MKYKLIIFDLDGVLVDAKNIHYETLNTALREIDEKYIITEAEHLSIYDGLKTNQKLDLLTKNKGLPTEYHKQIWNRKQNLTIEVISKLEVDDRLVSIFKELRDGGYLLACCSNSIRRSVLVMLSKIGVIEYMDLIISNEDVKNSKPHPEMYWKAMASLGVLPEETLVVEDSPHGLMAASRANCNILRVKDPEDLTFDKIFRILNNTNYKMMKPKWKDETLNVVIPMAGAGSRFEQAGYTFPKPLIDVMGNPMIQMVVENLNIDATFTFIVQKSHREKYNLDTLLNLITPNCNIVEVESVTEGAACTVLLAKEFINNDSPMILANSDQWLDWDSNEFMYKMNESDCDGGIVTFTATHPKWSFAKVNEYGYVTEVAEKNPISSIATVGVYYWKMGSDFVKYAEQMIQNDVRVNGEFYVAPVFNEAIGDGKMIRTHHINRMLGTGTPEDLDTFINEMRGL
jgi:HAD superfamily hydrolase (TIGR01509 family)